MSGGSGLALALGLATVAHAHPAARRLAAAAEKRGLQCTVAALTLECRPAEAEGTLPPARLDLRTQQARWDRASASARELLLSEWLESLPPPTDWEVPSDFAAAAPRLRLRVRTRVHALHRTPPAARLPLGDHLVAELVLQGTASRRTVPMAWLASWQTSLPDAALAAARNQGAPLVPPAPTDGGPPVTVVAASSPSDMAADLLPSLMLDAWSQGPVLALVRSSSELLLTPLHRSDGVHALLEAAEGASLSGVPLSHQPLVWRDGAWHSWRPAQDAPDAARWLAVIAHEQTLFDESGLGLLDNEPGFHGALSAGVREGVPGTLATWVPASSTVPVADWLALSNPDETAYIVVPWSSVSAVLTGHLAPLAGHHPPRMRVEKPLDAAIFATLALHAPEGLRPMR